MIDLDGLERTVAGRVDRLRLGRPEVSSVVVAIGSGEPSESVSCCSAALNSKPSASFVDEIAVCTTSVSYV